MRKAILSTAVAVSLLMENPGVTEPPPDPPSPLVGRLPLPVPDQSGKMPVMHVFESIPMTPRRTPIHAEAFHRLNRRRGSRHRPR